MTHKVDSLAKPAVVHPQAPHIIYPVLDEPTLSSRWNLSPKTLQRWRRVGDRATCLAPRPTDPLPADRDRNSRAQGASDLAVAGGQRIVRVVANSPRGRHPADDGTPPWSPRHGPVRRQGVSGDQRNSRPLARPGRVSAALGDSVLSVGGCEGDPFQHRGTVSLGSASPASLPPRRRRCWRRSAAVGQIVGRSESPHWSADVAKGVRPVRRRQLPQAPQETTKAAWAALGFVAGVSPVRRIGGKHLIGRVRILPSKSTIWCLLHHGSIPCHRPPQ